MSSELEPISRACLTDGALIARTVLDYPPPHHTYASHGGALRTADLVAALYWKLMFWHRAYFVSSVGGASCKLRWWCVYCAIFLSVSISN